MGKKRFKGLRLCDKKTLYLCILGSLQLLAVRLEVCAEGLADVDVAGRLARDPRMVQNLVGREALGRVHLQERSDHALGCVVNERYAG